MAVLIRNADIGRFTHPLHLLNELRALGPVAARVATVKREVAPWLALRDDHGALLALMEGERLFSLRDAAVSALSVEANTRQDASRVALVGAGPHAGLLLKTVRLVRSLRQLRIWDEDLPRAHQLAMRLFGELSLPAHASGTVEEAVADADIVVVSVPLPTPVVFPENVHATFVGEEARPEHDVITAWHIYQGAKDDESLERVDADGAP